MKQVAAAATAGRLTIYRYYCDWGAASAIRRGRLYSFLRRASSSARLNAAITTRQNAKRS